METVRGYSITGYWYKENNQLWHNCGQKGLTVPAYRGILEQFFFLKVKKTSGTLGTPLFWLISVGISE